MKNIINLLIILSISLSLEAQFPSSFSWKDRHSYHYLPINAKDQLIQGPCGVFATIAAVEAMCQIYYNNIGTTTGLFDFSEAYVYNFGYDGCPGIGCESANASSVLDFAKNTGLIDNNSFTFTLGKIEDNCILDCSSLGTPSQRIFVPNMNSWQIPPDSINTVDKLKKAILDYGPIIMQPGPGAYNACALHPNDQDCTNRSHTVLLTGWSGSDWEIWDSWPGAPSFGYKTYDVFYFNSTFYRVYPVDPQNSNDVLRCTGNQYELFSRKWHDQDGDGFYSWGLEYYGRPSGCPGPDFMDWDDGDENHIFRVGNTILQTPTISGSSDLLCTSDTSRTFTLTNIPDGFSTPTWSITKNSTCFNSPTSGTGSSATIYPNSSCIGKQCEITFSISHNGTASYKKSFYLNGPREDLVSISVTDSYGGSPAKYGDTYYLCPNTTYMIYYNNYDNSCTTWDFSWVLPYGWTEHYRSANYVSINTNDYPDGYLDILAKTSCCSEYSRVKVLNPFFGAAECGGYFFAYPNPSNNSLEININQSNASQDLSTVTLLTDAECQLTIVDKSGLLKYKTEFKGFPYNVETSNLPDGLYFINLICNNKKSIIRIVVKH